MTFIIYGVVLFALCEISYASGYYRWNCPARELHDYLSKRSEGVRD